MASLVTAPLERQLGQIPSLTSMTSSSAFGISQITLQFDLGRDIDSAAQDVQAAINAAGSTLPRTLPYPPTYAKVNPADAPIVTLALTSPHLLAAPAQRHRRYADAAAAERGDRRRTRLDPGRRAPGGAHPGGPVAARQLRHRHGGFAHRHHGRERRGAEGHAGRRPPVLHHRRERPDRRGGRLSRHRHRLSQRRAGAALRRRRRGGGAGEHQGRRLVQGPARGDPRHPAPARRQRHRDRGAHPAASCRGWSG